MVSVITFLIILCQLAAVIISAVKDIQPLFDAVLVQASPVMVFFGALDMITGYGGKMSFFFWPALAYCVIKYILLAISLKNDELGFFNVGALFMEVLYIAYSSYFIVTHNYF